MCGYLILGAAIHEAAHIFLLKCIGIPVNSVKIGLGSVLISHAPCRYWQEVLCAAAGPASNLLFGFLLMRRNADLACVNFLLGIGNMLPIYPLDGGRILYAVLAFFLDESKARNIQKLVHTITCMAMMIVACWVTIAMQAGVWPIFAVMVLLLRIDGVRNGENEKPVAFPQSGS